MDSEAKRTWRKKNMKTLGITIKKEDAEIINNYILDNYNNCRKSAFYKACIYYCIDNNIDIAAYIKEK